MAECRRIGGCPTGGAVLTGAGRLKCRKVIHAVGPIYRGGGSGEAEKLASAYRTSLQVASENGLRSVAFPSLSTGAYGYPIDQAATVALGTVIEYLTGRPEIERVRFVLFGKPAYDAYARALVALKPDAR
jgi:O-acetyl-ADP-ribose deacetylase (regulator of RNase III)